jgi:lipid-binding SYLF domain-containing protein
MVDERQHFNGELTMKPLVAFIAGAAMLLSGAAASADEYRDTVDLFRNTGESASFFGHSYGYAVFPAIGKGGLIVGAAHGNGRVYEHGKYVGDVSMTQLSVGAQVGGQAYSQIIFFEDQRSFKDFTRGDFELGADASVVAITAAASGTAGSAGADASASGGRRDAATAGGYHKGLAVFTIVKGGAMAEASVAGEKFSFRPKPG